LKVGWFDRKINSEKGIIEHKLIIIESQSLRWPTTLSLTSSSETRNLTPETYTICLSAHAMPTGFSSKLSLGKSAKC
jgi:hypothetical protein